MTAVRIVQKMKKAAHLVKNPRPTKIPPTSSENAAAASHSQGGRMKLKGVVPEIHALKPGPLKTPSTICKPCATIMTASARRMGIVIQVEEVAISLRNILIASCLVVGRAEGY